MFVQGNIGLPGWAKNTFRSQGFYVSLGLENSFLVMSIDRDFPPNSNPTYNGLKVRLGDTSFPSVPRRPLPLYRSWRVYTQHAGGVETGLHFYAPVLLLAGIAIAAWPRFRNTKRRGNTPACSSCGYDLTGLDRCPECGEPTTPGT